MPHLELACFTPHSALAGINAGASRLELCAGPYSTGGLTPTLPVLTSMRRLTSLPIYCMIRPRTGDFVYSPTEFQEMKDTIKRYENVGPEKLADGFVFGILTAEGRVDGERCRELVRAAGELPCTFHRAFDEAGDQREGLEVLIEVGFEAVLTAGGKGKAEQGAERLRELRKWAGSRIEIVVGGGVRSENVVGLMERVGAEWYHSAAIVEGEEASEAEVREIVQALKMEGKVGR